MMRNIALFIVLLSSVMSAQTSTDLFEKANNLYRQNKYEDALDLYEKIKIKNDISSELYFNIANCYYKLNKVAPSIYNYELALLINPSNKDAKNNLTIAHKLTLDRIEPLPQNVFEKFSSNFLNSLHYDTWAFVVVIFSIITSLFFILFYLSRDSLKKRIYFSISILNLLLLIFSIVITFHQFNEFHNVKHAIIYSNEISIKNAPNLSSDDVFLLHEGTKVSVIDSVDQWNRIRLIDGKTGWIQNQNIKIIGKF